ncbi:glycosyltransferase family 2 protein [Enterobacter hormaechei]|uniref:glycosyltransferase family 2 protein n=1 Tax=Enterobacter hormaechei TaxID=158836 RepID=UPI000908069D|nr:glycosyltransferase family A protein [Enterobacter hormaechei]
MKTREFGISVVIPSYNRIDTLLRAVDSIDSCQREKVEIIVVDDCSDFDIYSVLQRNNKNNIPIRIYKNSTNKGPQVSRNVGIRRASFEFVAFLDSDDYFSPDKIDWLLQILANQDIDLLYHAVDGCEKYNKISNLWFKTFGKLLHFRWFICLLNPCVTPSVVIRVKKCLFNPTLRYSEDYAFLLSYVESTTRVKYCDSVHTTVPRAIGTTGGVSGNLIKMRKGEIKGKENLLRKKNVSHIFQYALSLIFVSARVLSDLIRKRYNFKDFIKSN